MSDATIAAGFLAALLGYATKRGADRTSLLRQAGLTEAALGDPDDRVALERYLSLFAASIDACEDPALALHFGESVPMRDISVVGLVTESAGSATSAVELLNRYAFLTMDEGRSRPAERVALVREGGNSWLTFASPLLVEHRVLAESSFARCICGARAMAAARNGGAQVPFLKAIHFTHAEPDYRDEYDRLFAVPIVFGSDRNAWLLEERYVAAMQPPAESYSTHALRSHADALLARVDEAATVRAQVEHFVNARLATGTSMTEASRALGLSRQTLLRRLRSEGTTYEEVVDGLRRKKALEYVERGKMSVKQAAFEVGYADVAAFSRAFKRWTGHRPRAYLTRERT